MLPIMWTVVAATSAVLQRRAILTGTAGAVGTCIFGTEAWMRFPVGVAALPASVASALSSPDDVTVIIGGSAGPDRYAEQIAASLRSIGKAPVVLDWRTNNNGDSWSIFSSAMQAGTIARRFGSAVGQKLGLSQPKTIHAIGISAGGFAADALITAVRKASPQTHLRLTLLDAFTAGDLIEFVAPDTAAGVNSFGADADYCEAFINTDDPIPSTKVPLQQAVTIDVTASELRAEFEREADERGDTMHLWPADYYAKVAPMLLKAEKGILPKHGENGFAPRGAAM